MGEVAAAAQAARRDRRIDTVVLAKCRRKSQTMWPARLCSKREVRHEGGVGVGGTVDRTEGGHRTRKAGVQRSPVTSCVTTACPMILLRACNASTPENLIHTRTAARSVGVLMFCFKESNLIRCSWLMPFQANLAGFNPGWSHPMLLSRSLALSLTNTDVGAHQESTPRR